MLELLTDESKCVHAVYRGARRKRGLDLDLLVPYLMSWRDREGLVTIRTCEAAGDSAIEGSNLYSALYLNELIRKGIRQGQESRGLFSAYQTALTQLSSTSQRVDRVLREFEREFLKSLGYEVRFDWDWDSRQAIQTDVSYRYIPEQGFVPSENQRQDTIEGQTLLAIAKSNYEDGLTRRTAKLVLRQAIQFHLGSDTIKAQELLTATQYRDSLIQETKVG